jgi:starch-binding outer membrane protein, SusD/RagB family
MRTFTLEPKYLTILVLFLGATGQYSCKKFVEIDPPTTSIAGSTVYSNNTSAEAVMTGMYSDMIVNPGLSSGYPSIGYLMGLAADELTNYVPSNVQNVQFYENALSSSTANISNYYFWRELYKEIYVTNAVLEGLANSSSVTDSIKRQLTGEAKFMRGFLYFYATNLYGDVPLATTTDYLINNTNSRTPQTLVYKQIISDLKDAESNLSTNFVDANGNLSTERTRPNQGAASALLARAYLYTTKWDSAELEATKTIGNQSLYGLDSLNAVFLANSTETIWQLQPVAPGKDTWDAFYYYLHGAPGSGAYDVTLSTFLANSFETGDARWVNWVGIYNDGTTNYYYPFKYQVWQRNVAVTEYTTVLRLAEQYLIRAEARAEQGNINGPSGALADLNFIRTRAWLSNYEGPTDQQSVLSAILHERQIELFSEWGHRWFDLKRTNNLNSVMGSPGNVCISKNGTWSPDWVLLPIALQELKVNHNLAQNPGY